MAQRAQLRSELAQTADDDLAQTADDLGGDDSSTIGAPARLTAPGETTDQCPRQA